MPPLDDALRAATALAQSGRIGEAIPAFQSILRQDPRHTEAHRLLAIAHLSTGQFQEGIASVERAIASAPQRADLYHLYAEALAVTGQLPRAIDVLDQSLELNPNNPQAHALLATCLMQSQDLAGAEEEYAEALRLNPAFAEAATNYANVLTMTGRPQEGARIISDAAARHPSNLPVLTNRAILLNYADGVSREDLFRAHQDYGRAVAAMPSYPLPLLSNSREPDRRLRVGLLSPDLFDHSVAYFIRAVLEHRQRDSFEYFIYSTSPRADSMTNTIRPLADTWRDATGTSDQQLINQIRADTIDLLIELSGHTQGHRLSALRMRGAPIQVTYLGYPNTTGLPTMDYRLTDSLADPPDAKAFHTETLIRLDPCFLCYTPSPAAPPVARPPSAPAGHITFGSFNSIKKLTPSTMSLWCRLLNEVDGSRLLIKSGGLSSPHAQEHLRDLARAEGIDDERVELLDRTDSKVDHLTAYNRLDIALDTFPYHGTTTTCEALWQGVPVVSLIGDRHASRVGLSLLTAAGLPEFVANTPDEFIRIAAALARDPARLSLRESIRSTMQRSALCDAAAFSARFHAALRAMWRDHCRF